MKQTTRPLHGICLSAAGFSHAKTGTWGGVPYGRTVRPLRCIPHQLHRIDFVPCHFQHGLVEVDAHPVHRVVHR